MVEHWQNLENQKGEELGYVMRKLRKSKYTNLKITSVQESIISYLRVMRWAGQKSNQPNTLTLEKYVAMISHLKSVEQVSICSATNAVCWFSPKDMRLVSLSSNLYLIFVN